MQQRFVRRDNKVGVECNCGRCVKRIGRPDTSGLKVELLKLKAHCSRRQVEN